MVTNCHQIVTVIFMMFETESLCCWIFCHLVIQSFYSSVENCFPKPFFYTKKIKLKKFISIKLRLSFWIDRNWTSAWVNFGFCRRCFKWVFVIEVFLNFSYCFASSFWYTEIHKYNRYKNNCTENQKTKSTNGFAYMWINCTNDHITNPIHQCSDRTSSRSEKHSLNFIYTKSLQNYSKIFNCLMLSLI